MANPTEIDLDPAVVLATTTEQAIILHSDREYDLQHDGEDETGAASVVTIYLAVGSGSVDADSSEGSNKAKLLNGRFLTIGPGVRILKFKTGSGKATFTIIGSARYRGLR